MTEDHCMFCARIYHMIRKLWIRANPVASFAILLEWNKHLDISELLPLLQRHYLYFHHLLHELPFFLSLTWYDKYKKLWNDLLEVNKQVTDGVTDGVILGVIEIVGVIDGVILGVILGVYYW